MSFSFWDPSFRRRFFFPPHGIAGHFVFHLGGGGRQSGGAETNLRRHFGLFVSGVNLLLVSEQKYTKVFSDVIFFRLASWRIHLHKIGGPLKNIGCPTAWLKRLFEVFFCKLLFFDISAEVFIALAKAKKAKF